MINHSLFFGWNNVRPGQEVLALELNKKLMGFWAEQKKVGNIVDFVPVMLTAHNGDLNGFTLVTGDRQKLLDLRWNNEAFLKMHLECNMILDGYACVDGYVGESLEQVMGMWGQIVSK